MSNQLVISPIFYMGNKKKLIKKGLIELFPNNIDTIIELFGGSSIVSMNSTANNYFISDIDCNLVSLYKLFKYQNSDLIIGHIKNRVDEYGLAKERTKRNEFKDKETSPRGGSYSPARPWRTPSPTCGRSSTSSCPATSATTSRSSSGSSSP